MKTIEANQWHNQIQVEYVAAVQKVVRTELHAIREIIIKKELGNW